MTEHAEEDQRHSQNKNRQSVIKLSLLAIGMFGFAFALVPLYDVFCDITGINGKTSNVQAQASNKVDRSRQVTVEFVAYIDKDMPWQFAPQVETLKVFPGETHKISYLAKNLSIHEAAGQAVPSVSPGLAAQYLNKIECFCFNRQALAAGEQAELPLLFYVDPELPDDIKTLTLSYTLFSADQESAVQAKL